MVALEAVDLHYKYSNGVWALRGVNIAVDTGECVVVLGRNGSGKTTLTMVLAGLYRPAKGLVRVFGEELSRVSNIRRLIGVVFQDADAQIIGPTVIDDVLFTLRQIYGLDKARVMANHLLREFRLYELRNRVAHNLSAGEKRRLTLATAVAHDPKILLMDEPFADLDPFELNAVLEFIKKLRSRRAILITTHNPWVAKRIADRIYIISHGRIVRVVETPSDAEELLRAIADPRLSE